MSETQKQVGATSHLMQELDNRLYYAEPVVLRNNRTGDIKLCRVFYWRDENGNLHHEYFAHNQQPKKIVKTLVSGGYTMPLNKKGLLMTASQLKKEMFSCAVGLVV